jgi:hypothetical protein
MSRTTSNRYLVYTHAMKNIIPVIVTNAKATNPAACSSCVTVRLAIALKTPRIAMTSKQSLRNTLAAL